MYPEKVSIYCNHSSFNFKALSSFVFNAEWCDTKLETGLFLCFGPVKPEGPVFSIRSDRSVSAFHIQSADLL